MFGILEWFWFFNSNYILRILDRRKIVKKKKKIAISSNRNVRTGITSELHFLDNSNVCKLKVAPCPIRQDAEIIKKYDITILHVKLSVSALAIHWKERLALSRRDSTESFRSPLVSVITSYRVFFFFFLFFSL